MSAPPRSADVAWMRRALELASLATGATSPNPLVGCVIVGDGERVGEGYHTRCGQPHAEPVALAAAGERARGATLYVNLEPCSHFGRTPPCTEAILAAGVSRVVCGMIDPNPVVSGRGVAQLRAAGVEVTVGVCEAAATRLNAGFVIAQRERRPMVSVKLATSLDGRIAAEGGESAWISGPEARAEVHAMRVAADAVLVGPGTLRADRPRLNARGADDAPLPNQPRRVVLDPELSAGDDLALWDTDVAPTWVACAEDAPRERRAWLESRGVRVVPLPTFGGGLDEAALLEALFEDGCVSVLCEGGGGLAGRLLERGLVDRWVQYIAALFLGARGVPSVGALPRRAMREVERAAFSRVGRLGADVVLEAVLSPHLALAWHASDLASTSTGA